MRHFTLLIGHLFVIVVFGSSIDTQVSDENCTDATCMNLQDAIPYGGSSIQNVSRPTPAMSFTADNLRTFYESITKGESLKIDQAVRFEPFNGMDKHLLTAPYAVALMAQLSLIGAKRDIDLSGGLKDYKYLQAPSSFRASLGQAGNEAFKAFRNANKAMLGIEVLTSHFEGQLRKILTIIFHKDSDVGIKTFLPSVLNRTLSIVEGSAQKIDSVIGGFDYVQNILNEIYLGSLTKKGEKEKLHEELLKQKKMKALEKKKNANRIRTRKNEIERLNAEIKGE